MDELGGNENNRYNKNEKKIKKKIIEKKNVREH